MYNSLSTEYRHNKGQGYSWQAGGSRAITLMPEDEELDCPMPHDRRLSHKGYGRPGLGV